MLAVLTTSGISANAAGKLGPPGDRADLVVFHPPV